MEGLDWKPQQLTLLNNEPFQGRSLPGAVHVEADALDIPFPSWSFDLAMSNSVIEHVTDQARFACEMLRVGKRVYCQTPSKYFPIEPHCLGLFVHWLPKAWFPYFVYRYLTIYGWIGKPDRAQFEEFKKEVHLLSKFELKRLFPNCRIQTERFLGLPKSYVVTRDAPVKKLVAMETRPKRERPPRCSACGETMVWGDSVHAAEWNGIGLNSAAKVTINKDAGVDVCEMRWS